jgi:GTP-binding protein YchF
VEKQRDKFSKNSKSGAKDAKERFEECQKLESHLGAGGTARKYLQDNNSELAQELCQMLLTAKPILYVANVSEDEINHQPTPGGGHPIDRLAAHAANQGAEIVVISGQVESELADLGGDERAEYLQELGVELSGLDRLTLAGYETLNLITFFTVGPKEAHAWTVVKGTSAPQSAGKIHSDFERGFIRAEVIGYDDYVLAGSEVKAKEAGKLRVEGKEYITRDGDIMHFRFNV